MPIVQPTTDNKTVVLLVAAILLGQQNPLKPPFKRIWTIGTTDQIDGYQRQGNLVAYGGFQYYGVANIQTGKMIWEHKLKDKTNSSEVAFAGKLLIVSVGNDSLYALEPATGKKVWSIPRTGFSSPIGVNKGVIFQELSFNRLSAIRAADHKILWTSDLGPPPGKKSADERNPVVAARPLFSADQVEIPTDIDTVVCFNIHTGQRLWSTYTGDSGHRVAASNSTIFIADSDLAALSRSKGTILWRARTAGAVKAGPVLCNGRLFVLTEMGHLESFDGATGERVLEKSVVSAQRFVDAGLFYDSDGIVLGLLQGDFRRYSRDGDLRWQTMIGTAPTDQPMERLGDRFLVAQGNELSLYGPGSGLVQNPAAMAKTLADKIGSLDTEDYMDLRKLGEAGYQAVFPKFKAALLDYAKAAKTHPKNVEKESDRYSSATDALEEVMSPRHSKELIDLLKVSRPEEKGDIYRVLAAGGDPKLIVPIFTSTVAKPEKDSEGRSPKGVALSYLLKSKDPLAVKFLMDQIKDPHADPDIRWQAYTNVAGNGGPDAARLAISLRSKRRLLPSFADRMDLSTLGLSPGSKTYPTQVVATKRDSKGVLWGLLTSGVAGAESDMWVVHESKGHWIDPLFTGFLSDRLEIKKGESETQTFHGLNRDQIIAGHWFEQFVGNPALSADSDRDGLTDVLEARFQTNPNSADSDGDGIPDGKDATPNGPTRALSDPEKVMAAAFEARYHYYREGWGNPALFVAPEGLKPFELIGWPGVVVWTSDEKSAPLHECYGTGVAIIRFDPLPEAELLPKSAPITDHFIHWNKDRSEAELTISTYFGALDGTGYRVHVKRFGPDWVVTSMTMSYIS